jgi:Putative adhesin
MSTTRTADTTLEHEIGPRGRFELRQSSGEIAIRGVEGATVRVRSLDGRALSDLFEIEAGDGALELRQYEGLGIGFKLLGRRESAELSIEVPHGASVSIDTQSADIEATDLSGVKTFRSASGEVALHRLAGPVDVETVSGEVDLDGNAPVDVTARSVSGDMQLRVPAIRRLDLSTTSGDVRLDAELTGQGPFALRSISGDVTVVGRAGFRVEAESITGDLSSDLPSKRESTPGRKVLIVGRPGPTLAFKSVSGDFHVAAPRDAGPTAVMPPTAPPTPTAPAAPTAPTPPDGPTPPSPPDSPAAQRPADAPTAPTSRGNPEDARSVRAGDDDDARMDILRALERGDITVADATVRLGQLDEVPR